MKTRAETITAAWPIMVDDVYLFPQEWDVPTVEGRNQVGWTFVDLRHLDAPARYRPAAVLADGRVLLPAMLFFKTETRARKAVLDFQRPMAAEVYRDAYLVEVALLRSRFVRESPAARLVDELAAIAKATVEGKVAPGSVLIEAAVTPE